MNKYNNIAKHLIFNSVNLKENSTVYIDCRGKSQKPLLKAVLKLCKRNNINYYLIYNTDKNFQKFWENCSDKELQEIIAKDSDLLNKSNAYILLKSNYNFTLSSEQEKKYNQWFHDVHWGIRINKPWCITQLPDRYLAKSCKINKRKLIKLYIKSATIDYNLMYNELQPLKKVIENGRSVKIIAPNTNISFKLDNLPVILSYGQRNLPDGEIYTAPVRDSINGTITYNVPAKINGITHENISFVVKNGKIIHEQSSNTEALTNFLNTDEGARYFGEFALGQNWEIKHHVITTLFDEKILGSIHLTPGNAYSICDNGNRSKIHCDLVLNLNNTDGEIYIDDKLILKDGKYIPSELSHLNK